MKNNKVFITQVKAASVFDEILLDGAGLDCNSQTAKMNKVEVFKVLTLLILWADLSE